MKTMMVYSDQIGGKPLLIVSKERVVSPDGETKHREQERGTNGR